MQCSGTEAICSHVALVLFMPIVVAVLDQIPHSLMVVSRTSNVKVYIIFCCYF